MKNQKKYVPIIALIMAVLLVACGPSDEKLSEAEEARSLLAAAKQTAEDTYLDVSDTSQRIALDELAQKEAEIEQLDFKKLNDKKIDEILPGIAELTESYQNIGKELSNVLTDETKVREEKAKHKGLDTYFINKTGMNLTKIVLHDISADTYSDNYIGEGVSLLNGYTLMGVSLDIYADSSEWEFVITDDVDNEYTLSCESLKGQTIDGAAIVLSYDPAAAVGEATLGGYFPQPEPEPESAPESEGEENAEDSGTDAATDVTSE